MEAAGASGVAAKDGGSAGGAQTSGGAGSAVVPAAAAAVAAGHPDAPPGLPPSSTDLPLALKDVDALLSAYSTLRGFNFVLRLSPFTFRMMCSELASGVRPCLPHDDATAPLSVLRLAASSQGTAALRPFNMAAKCCQPLPRIPIVRESCRLPAVWDGVAGGGGSLSYAWHARDLFLSRPFGESAVVRWGPGANITLVRSIFLAVGFRV